MRYRFNSTYKIASTAMVPRHDTTAMRMGGNPLAAPAGAAAAGTAGGAAAVGNCMGGTCSCICGADMEGGVNCGACIDGGVMPDDEMDGPVTDGADIWGLWICGAWKPGTAGNPAPPAAAPGAAGAAGAEGGGGKPPPPPGAGAPPRITMVNSPGPAGVIGIDDAAGAVGSGPRNTCVAPSNDWCAPEAAGACWAGGAGGVYE